MSQYLLRTIEGLANRIEQLEAQAVADQARIARLEEAERELNACRLPFRTDMLENRLDGAKVRP